MTPRIFSLSDEKMELPAPEKEDPAGAEAGR